MNAPSAWELRRLPPGDRGPHLAILARRHLAKLAEIKSQPNPEEPLSIGRRRARHHKELARLVIVARMLSLKVSVLDDMTSASISGGGTNATSHNA